MNPEPIVRESSAAPPPAPREFPPGVHHAHRRPLGSHPVPVLAVLAGLTLVVSIILLGGGSLIGGLILLAIGAGLVVLFIGGVRREPDAPVSSATLRATGRLREVSALAAVGARAWVRAGVDLVRIRHRRMRLRSELRAGLAPLGEAVHEDDTRRAEELKQQTALLEQQLDEADHAESAAIAAARQAIHRERATSEPTEVLSRKS